MKIILIIQSLIILAGAYYVYTLQTRDERIIEPVFEETLPASTEATTTETLDTSATTVPTAESETIAGPNDAGMEWPVFNGELEVR